MILLVILVWLLLGAVSFRFMHTDTDDDGSGFVLSCLAGPCALPLFWLWNCLWWIAHYRKG